MKQSFKIVLFLTTLFILPSLTAVYANTTFIYLLVKKDNVGDLNQGIGIAHALKKLLSEKVVQKEFDLSEKDTIEKTIHADLGKDPGKSGIIISTESSAFTTLKTLSHRPNIVLVYSSHQNTPDHINTRDITDLIALPKHTLSPEKIQMLSSPYTTVIPTVDVSHNLSLTTISEEYEKHKEQLPKAQRYIAVILGGDAPTQEGKILYYTPKEAQKLGRYIAQCAQRQKAHLIILNGPRTGKHDPKTGQVRAISHRNGNVDPVTQAFLAELKKQGITSGQQMTLLDFQYGQPSFYKAVLGLLHKTNSPIYVAGESTSMVSETADCLDKEMVTVYTHQAMNASHLQHCQNEKEAGRINILRNYRLGWQLLKATSNKNMPTNQSASQVIAIAIIKRLQEKRQN